MNQDYLDQLKDLPVMPEVAAKIMNVTEGRLEMSFKELESIIKMDTGLTTKILKIANSALYARQREIKSLQVAITMLGFKNIRSLVLLITASRLFPRMQKSSFHTAYWRHSVLSAFMCRLMAIRCGRNDVAEEAFIAGLLHDIGKAALYNAAPEEYTRALEEEKSGARLLEAIEEQVFGVSHRRLGGQLLAKWNFPTLYADVAFEHDTLNINSAHKSLIILVSVACLTAERVDDQPLSTLKQAIFRQLVPYTCLDLAEAEGAVDAYKADLAADPLYREYQALFGLPSDASG